MSRSLRRGRRRFRADRKGNVSILFAFCMVPVIAAMGAALDYSLANADRTQMQAALDSAGLALSRMMPLTQTQLDDMGLKFFNANLGPTSLTDVQLSISANTGLLTLSAQGTYTTSVASVLQLLGLPTSFPIGVHTDVKWGIGKVEVALALDNTGSMASSGKINQLKIAAHNLLNTLQNAAKNPGDAKVAIVPFGTEVNVGTGYVNASWLRWDLWDANNQTCVTVHRRTTCTPKPHSNWNGCVIDRDQQNDVLDTTPTSSTSTQYPAEQCVSAITTMMPLSYDWTALNNKIDQMIASGNTNVTIGLVWGWHALSPTDVLTEGAAYNTPNLTKYIIALTDGTNTENRWTTSQYSIDARTALACSNAKAAGIKIYTIRVIDGNATLLRNCASDPSMYYDVQDANQLSGVFGAIGSQIANLHLSR